MPPRGKKTPLKKPSPSAKSPVTRIAKEPTSVQELESLPNIEEEKTVTAEEVSDLKTVTAVEEETEVSDLKTVTAEEEKTEVSDLKTEAHLSSETVKEDKENEVSEKAEEMEDELEDQVKEEKDDEGFEDPEEIIEGEEQENEEEVPEGQEDGMDIVNLEDDEEGSDEEEDIIDGTEEGDANEAAQMDQDPGTNQEVTKEETRTDEVDNTERDGADVAGPSENREKSASDDEEDEEGNEDEEDPSLYMHAPLSDRKKEKEFEIFVGGLDKGAVEEDLRKVFGDYGEVQSVRIVKHPTTKKSKGYAFIRYGTIEQAKNVLTELKDGTEVKGKLVGISASQDNDTLYMSNICKTWTKEHLLETLKGYGVEQIEEICLPEDDKNEGKNKGFALLEFSTHSVAMTAFQRLRKPDAVFGCDRSARVSFAQSSMNPSEEALSQVKTVYVEGLPSSWDEEQVKDHCKEYGEIEKIQLSRNFTTARRKDFGFISFASRESAVACVEGINNAQIGDGNAKMKANLAKPHNKSRLAKQGPRGGFKVKKDVESTGQTAHPKKAKGKAKSKGSEGIAKSKGPEGKAKSNAPEGKGKAPSSLKNGKGGHPLKPQGKVSGVRGDAPTRDSQRKQQSKGGKHGGKNTLPDNNPRSSKKSQGKMHSRPSNDSGNRKNSRFGKPKENYLSRPASGYAAASGTKRQYSDMEPHAGYLRPAAKQSRRSYGHEQRSAGGYKNYASPRAGYVAGPVPQPTYGIQYSGYSGYEPAYVYPSSSGPYPPSSGVYPPYGGAYAPSGGIYPPPRHYY